MNIESCEPMNIAIIGMSGRFPDADSVKGFWKNLRSGHESVRALTREELESSGVSPDLLKNERYIKYGSVIDQIDMFDADFFRFTPHEAKFTDPQHRIFLECVWEALEDSGYMPDKYRGFIGLFGSTSMSSYLIHNLMRSEKVDTEDMLYALLMGNDKDFLCTRAAYKLNLKGPALTIQTACSSSLVALHYACQSLIRRECDIALAGGVSISVPQKAGYLYKEGGIMSRDGRCRPFDSAASGTVKGNGCGIVVLKQLERALEDQDQIYAVIKSTAINNDGSQKIGFTAPSVNGQIQVIQKAVKAAGIDPQEIGYLEAHGTGTTFGDPIEMRALTSAFNTTNNQFCAIGSVKGNIGHLDAAAGIIGVIKTALVLKEQTIPPMINFSSVNKQIKLEKTPFYVNTELEKKQITFAGVSSFGIGGTNAHALLERPPVSVGDGKKKRQPYLFILSAQQEESLKDLSRLLADYVHEHSSEPIVGPIAHMLAKGRSDFSVRYCFVADSVEQVLEGLNKVKAHDCAEGQRKFSYRFGWNSELAEYLYENSDIFRESVLQCVHMNVEETHTPNTILKQAGSHSIAYLTYNYALFRLLAAMGITSSTIALRHELDHLVHQVCDNVISPQEAVRCINEHQVRYSIESENHGNGEGQEGLLDFTFDGGMYDFLKRMGDVWASGMRIDVSHLFSRTYTKLSLPTYPFARKSYWIDNDKTLEVVRNNVETVDRKNESSDLETIIEIWTSYLEVEGITADSDFYELGGESFIAVEMVTKIRDHFKISMQVSDLLNLTTPREVEKFIHTQRKPRILEQGNPVIRVKAGTSKVPLFLIHPAGGTVSCYHTLSRHLKSDREIYGIQFPRELLTQTITLRDLAASYIKEMKKVQPEGPYMLGGYSFGGNVAYEMALQLQENNEEVSELVMFDSHAPEAYYGESSDNIPFTDIFPSLMSTFVTKDNDERLQLSERLTNVSESSWEQSIDAYVDVLDEYLQISKVDLMEFFNIWTQNHKLLKEYYPDRKLDADIVFFQASEKESSYIMDKLKIKDLDKRLWDDHITGSIRFIEVTGNHYSIFWDKKQVHDMALQVNQFLNSKADKELVEVHEKSGEMREVRI